MVQIEEERLANLIRKTNKFEWLDYVFENDEFDISLYNLGNCFCTFEDAKSARSKIKERLNKE
jgi:hypothetical protein